MKYQILLLLILVVPAFSVLLQPGYFPMHDDLQSMRQYQLDKCFADGQFPCRWVPDLGYGFGYPLFNFYPPGPYYLGHVFRLIGFSYIDIVKSVAVVGFILTAVFMYLLAGEFWGRKGGLLSALFYTYAPYHSVDLYVRGAVNEFWAMAFYPAVLWTSYRLIRDRGMVWIIGLALSFAGLLLSHNPMTMIFTPVLGAWCLFWLVKLRVWKPVFSLAAAGIWGLGLAAFFTLPVIFEQKFVSVWTLTSGYFNFLAHYLNLRQIFLDINWGYGSSELGPADTMSFALGHMHWLIPGGVLLFAAFSRQLRSRLPLLLLLASFVLVALFMTHSKSTPIWLAVKPLEFLQFPWRFLTVAVFASSLAAGAVSLLPGRMTPAVIAALVIAGNVGYFRPADWQPRMTDAEKFSGRSWQLLVTSGIFDYLPVFAPQPPADPAGGNVNVVSGRADYRTVVKNSRLQQYEVDVASGPAVLELQTYYFPGWRIWVDDREQQVDPARDPLLGRMQVEVPAGRHVVTARFTDTPVRTAGNIFSLISWALIIISAVRLWIPKSRWGI